MDASSSEERAGRYQRQPGNFAAFIPSDLPPDPPVSLTPEILDALSRADRALGRLDGATESLPNPDLFVFMYVRKEAVLSSQIEGTQASLLDVLGFEADAPDPMRPNDVKEVVSYVDAMNYGMKRIRSGKVSGRLIRQIHERLMLHVRGAERGPGAFRKIQNWIGPPGCSIQEATFVPPPADLIEPSLKKLEKFIYDDSPLPILIKVGLVHAQFESIHPFLDGNGRIGRLLVTILLCERDILRRPLLYLSHYFKSYREVYYGTLQAIRDSGDWEGWIQFFLAGVTSVAEEATVTARKIIANREETREMILNSTTGAKDKALLLIEELYQRPIISVLDVVDITNTAFATANRLTEKLVDLGILVEITGQQRNRRYRFEPYIRLFRDQIKGSAR